MEKCMILTMLVCLAVCVAIVLLVVILHKVDKKETGEKYNNLELNSQLKKRCLKKCNNTDNLVSKCKNENCVGTEKEITCPICNDKVLLKNICIQSCQTNGK